MYHAPFAVQINVADVSAPIANPAFAASALIVSTPPVAFGNTVTVLTAVMASMAAEMIKLSWLAYVMARISAKKLTCPICS